MTPEELKYMEEFEAVDNLEAVRILVNDGITRKGFVLDHELNRYVSRHPWCPPNSGALVWEEVRKTTRTLKLAAVDADKGIPLGGPFLGLGYKLIDNPDDSQVCVVNRHGRPLRPQTPKYGGRRWIFDTPKLGPTAQSWPLAKLREVCQY